MTNLVMPNTSDERNVALNSIKIDLERISNTFGQLSSEKTLLPRRTVVFFVKNKEMKETREGIL